MMLELFELPNNFNGGFVSGATMSNFTCLGVARQWAGKQVGRDIAREGMSGNIIVLSAVPHSSALKSLSMLGIGSSNIISVNMLNDREAIDINDLKEKLEQYKDKPIIVSCSGGTVNSVDFDDFAAIADLKKQYNFWMHIDAAFGGFAACSSSYKHLLKGWEHADSITIDCHKWMNVPYDSAIFFVKKTHNQLQVETFQNSNAPYLGDPEENFSYLNFLPENSRRFRALPAWFNLIAYGREGFKSIVDNNINNALEFGRWIENSEEFELVAPVLLNTVCFRLKENVIPAASFLKEVNSRGKVFMTPSVLKGQACIRAAFVNWRTTSQDLEIAKGELVTVFQQLSTKV
ncbi:L-2,4-diaminobutyrate decarboxylase [compost metagenome]